MDQFDALKAMGEFWTRTGLGFLTQPGMGPGTGGWGAFPQATDLAGFTEAQSSLTRAWAAATALSQTLTASVQGAGPAGDPTAGAVLARIFDPQAWLGGTTDVGAALNRMAEGPQLADLWQTEKRFGALFNAFAALRQAQGKHQAVMLDAWTRAAGAFAREANARAARGQTYPSGRDMMQHWIETANGVLLDVQRSEPFLASQRDVLKAATDLRLAQQDVAGFMADLYGQPTRAELDDVHRSLTELRREVRALKKERRSAARRAKTGATGEASHG
ncbi:poly(R)-hydroxyalkanoic acid synthase subunit PhaE [Methylobacterium sp. J-076]|uniref:poly(R)-hydroxyalkanoic acid synthase subunit PhaE n=1 Tax=Methylobacterium sp. J-076 TaxID=2836655 RepID=UPI001FBBA986|nr:poly(R)-hydroxyalkanoic acid synthase subunit PhaE [Methylobacterium sp. J-076]MCJ2014607.1 poly-beta-hydroxybutyrate polymerase subunit [Methylobacterium sp. J-076]